MYNTKESITWCYVRTSRQSVYSLYLRLAFPLTHSASFSIYRAVGSISYPFECCIEHDNELANHNFMICNSFKVTSEPKYL